QNQADALQSLNEVRTTLTLFLGSIAGISLLVGGIGIMNIMLVSVTERTREIGVRKALGARSRDVLAIWGIATVGLNLINGVTGILSLGHHGFMLIGGYVTGLLMLPEAARQNLQFSARNSLSDFALGLSVERWMEALGLGFLATPETLGVRFVVALVLGGLLAAAFGLVVGFPSLRLRGDYLAVVTFAFGEVIRLLASTPLLSSYTNGALGFAG